MSLLKTEPPAPVRSLAELFALAHALEEEAARWYAELAGRMEAQELPEVAAVFRDLVAEERSHAERVGAWAHGTSGAAPDHARIRWAPPDTLDREAGRQEAASRLASAYRALSMAVRNEERAFALWTYIAAQATEPAIQEAAERMAGEELRHAALLRQARRRAFHAERSHDAAEGAAPRRPPAEQGAVAEQALAAVLGSMADATAGGGEWRRLARESHAMAEEAATLAGLDDEPASAPPAAGEAMAEALQLSERTVEAYLAAADTAADEAGLCRLQSLAERAIARAVLLRRLAGED